MFSSVCFDLNNDREISTTDIDLQRRTATHRCEFSPQILEASRCEHRPEMNKISASWNCPEARTSRGQRPSAQFLLTISLSLKIEAPIDQLRDAPPFEKIGAVNPLVPLQDHDVKGITLRPSL